MGEITSARMLDPRIYRTGLIVAALALVVLAFSLSNQQPALGTTLSPAVFDGSNVVSTVGSIDAADPIRSPGSAGENALADQVVSKLGSYGFQVSTDTFSGVTVDGSRTLENVTGVRPGLDSGSIVIVAPRDAPGAVGASGTAMLIELARDLQGETLHRTVVLASVSGAAGAAGTARLASTLAGPVDAVIVLGDVASAHVRQPIVIPWSSEHAVAPPLLRNTLAAALRSQASLGAGSSGLGAQFARLAFPFTLGQQAPFAARGIPAVELSLSGERGPAPDAPLASVGRITGVGHAVLSTISALDGGAAAPAPSAYVLLAGKVVPGWAIALFVIALLVPILMTTVDGVARARRRGHEMWRSLALVLAAATPFLSAVLIVLAGSLLGAIGTAPSGPVAPGAVGLHQAGIEVLVLAAVAILAVGAAIQRLAKRLRVGLRGPEGATAATLVVLCAVTFAIWLRNPFAALLLAPALHVWLAAVNPDLRLGPLPRLALVAAGLAPTALVAFYYANAFGYSPSAAAWQAALLIAGHSVGPLAALEWSIVGGGVLSVVVLAARAARAGGVQPAPVTVRGPGNYAGPGSLGGTESALRRPESALRR
ncbi:MAG: hypothetical protein ACRDMX_06690 [Solirubrobacteraceae bacterium]